MARVAHFEIHSSDPEKAVKFYTDVFGWSFSKWDGPVDYWLITTGKDSEPGINGGLLKRQEEGSPKEGAPVNAFVCTVVVDDIDRVIEESLAAGATTALKKHEIPGIGWQFFFKDPDGNVVGVNQPK